LGYLLIMQTILSFLLLGLSLFLVARGARLIVKYTPPLALFLGMSGFLTSFFIIGIVSVFPEFLISIISGLEGVPTLGLGTLFGSNIADLTLVLGIAALFAQKGLAVRSDFLKDDLTFIAPLLLPVFLGLDGRFSQLDGAILITAGLLLFLFLYRRNKKRGPRRHNHGTNGELSRAVFLFAVGLATLVGGAYAAVVSAERISALLSLPEVLIGISFLTLGTLIPELSFSIRAAKAEEGELVFGDILGIVITDITLVLGAMALLSPFSFDPRILSVTGFSMIFAAMISLSFMKSGRLLSKNEGVILILLYIIFLSAAFSLQI